MVAASRRSLAWSQLFGTPSPLTYKSESKTAAVVFCWRTAFHNSFAASEEVLTGTYSVSRSCKVNMRYSFAGHDYGWLGVLTNGGRGANLMVSSPTGAVIGGTLLKTRGINSGS